MIQNLNQIINEQYIKDKTGNNEYVIIPINQYNIMKELLEDYGLGLAMSKAENDEIFNKDEALRFIEND